MITAAIVSIPGSVACILSLLGAVDSLKFAWLRPYAPYFYAVIACSILLWFVTFVLDYLDVRRSALADPSSNFTTRYGVFLDVERSQRTQDIEAVYRKLNAEVQRINEFINDLRPKPAPEQTLKQRTAQLANDLFALVNKFGPEPPNPLAGKTESEQQKRMKDLFSWKNGPYYNYMAHFRDRAVQIDYELAAEGIMTKLDETELDPPKNRGEVNIKKIAETLLLTAQQMM